MRKKYIKLIIPLLIFFFSGIFFTIISQKMKRNELENKIKKEIIKELGSEIVKEDFLNEYIEDLKIDTDLKKIKEVGEYNVTIKIKKEKLTIKVQIKDQTPPQLEVKDLTIYIDEKMPTKEDFIENIFDLSNYTIKDISIKKEIGEQEIEITVEDEYNNKTSKIANLTIKEDKEPPNFEGLSMITVEVGDKINYTYGVTAFDKRFGKMNFTVDDSLVDYHTPGTYNVYYYTEDPLKNSTKAIRKIIINPPDITYKIENFPTFHQFPHFPNGCESAALYNLLRFYKINITMDELVNTLKKGEGPYRIENTLYGGDPEIEFVGDPRDPHGYGVFQKPIIEVAKKYKSGIIDYTGHSLKMYFL